MTDDNSVDKSFENEVAATRKTIVEATSKIIGQKEVDHLSRGPLDLTRRIDELEAEVAALKMKLEMLDNRPSK